MNIIEVKLPGLLTTVQDLGREGFGPRGVSPSGAADPVALRLGNRLVGNPEGAAGLEMTLLGGTFVFPEGAIIALTGADFGAELDGASVPLWTSLGVKPGQTLRTGATRSGARCYLCVAGGIEEKPFLGSASTHLLSGLGGHQGRVLRKGDVLNIGSATSPLGKSPFRKRTPFCKKTIVANALQPLQPRKVLRITPGPQRALFPDAAQKIFYGNTYRVAEESNRMGLRLEGAPLPVDQRGEMITEGVSLGAVQITPAGLPIILFVEQQTTGGYPKIANIVSADFSSLGQLRPRDEIRFEPVDWDTARQLIIAQEALLTSEGLVI
jgi:antagonist of KipI